MLKNIVNLEGAQSLSKKEQMNVVGAGGKTPPQTPCIWPSEICRDGSVYDPCLPISQTNKPC